MQLKEYADILERFDQESRLRVIPQDRTSIPRIDMTSNDYLGLGAAWNKFMPEFKNRYPDASFSSSASRLLSARQDNHLNLENLLGSLYNKEVLLFNSGYHANVGIIQALAIPGTIFLCDKLVHASMIDGLKLSGAEYRRWHHNDIASLRLLLEKNRDKRCIVALESVYSMDGDIAPLKEIVALKKDYPEMILYVDEAHAFGTRGKQGLGVAEETGVIDQIDILVGTLGKAAASSGAFVATHPILKEYFVNCSRSFIFSTALPPINAAWSHFMIINMLSMTREREHLDQISRRFREELEKISGKPIDSRSHIVPFLIGDASEALKVATRLSLKGIDALPIRRPTVPEGGERIRFSLSSDMTHQQIDYVLEALKDAIADK